VQTKLDSFFSPKKQIKKIKKKIDGRSRSVRLTKAKKERKRILELVKQSQVLIQLPVFAEILDGARSHYMVKSYHNEEDYYEITRNGFINHIRHAHTNYEECLVNYKLLKTIPFTYRLSLGLDEEQKIYDWLKGIFNEAIEKQCIKVLSKFDEWRYKKARQDE